MEYLEMVVHNTLASTIYKDINAKDIIKNLPATVHSASHLNEVILCIAQKLFENTDNKA